MTAGKLTVSKDEIRFTASYTTCAAPAAPRDSVHAALKDRDTQLVVRNLAPGRYRLSTGGREAGIFDSKDLAAGIAVRSAGAHQSANNLRESIITKNKQFLYSWRALNQVHIVGERKKSPSGKALPGEVIEFAKLTGKHEGDLAAQKTPATAEEWKLERIK